MYDSLNYWLNRTRGGIAIVTSLMAVIMAAMSGIIGGEVVLLSLIALPQMLRLGYNQNLAIGTICASGAGHDDPAVDRPDHLRPDHRNLDQGAVYRRLHPGRDAGVLHHHLHHCPHADEPVAGAAARASRTTCPQAAEKLMMFGGFL